MHIDLMQGPPLHEAHLASPLNTHTYPLPLTRHYLSYSPAMALPYFLSHGLSGGLRQIWLPSQDRVYFY